ncbi:MAG TPA: NUDIX hydrolase [Candidatus Saccharimonadales bacterium]|nr:NUDIX hydrolase [Candidatus Saccharimonadales bacterium]
MDKQIKYTIAIIIKNPANPDEFLVVRRPDDDADLRGSWGFPATSAQPGELPEDCARRIAKIKLGCEAEPTRFLGIMFQRRNSYDIFLMDMEMELVNGSQPDINKADTNLTKYVEQKWSSDPMDLMPAAKHGSCCASIFLTDRGLLDRKEWIDSLEGSDLVA